jgi:uncharacterized protein (TIGR02231 family)
MLNLKTFFTAIIMAQLLYASANEKTIKSKPDKVTIFLTGAEVTHTSAVDLQSGTSTLVFNNLSPFIEKESIQASATNNVKVVAIDYGTIFITTKMQDSLKIEKVLDSLNFIGREKRKLDYEIETYEAEKKMILSIDHIEYGDKGINIIELQKLSELYRTRLMEINKQIYLLGNKNEDLKVVEDKYKAKLTRLKSEARGENISQIKLTIQVPIAGNSLVRLKYMAGRTGWSPKYDIHIQNVSDEIEIDYQANVMNQSGEDWENVNLILSTSVPSETQELPSLNPWTLNKETRTTNEGFLNQYAPKTVSKSTAQQQAGNLKILEGVEYNSIEIPDINMEFNIKSRYSIPSNGKPYLVEISKNKATASFAYMSIPKIEDNAYLMAQVTNWEKLNLLEGLTNIYYGDVYIGHSYIRPQYANDTLEISLGQDNKLMVNRIKVKDNNTKTLFGMNKIESFSYKISVRNTNSTNVKLSLMDQVPVSQDADIKVEISDISSAQLDPLSGSLLWKLDLKPGEGKELFVSFQVEYPKDKQIKIVGNRNIQKKFRTTSCPSF